MAGVGKKETEKHFLKELQAAESSLREKDPGPFKAWVYTVLSVTFLVAAMYQSLVFTMKFIALPTTTSYNFERFDALELPSFTICTNPSFHFEKLEKMADAYPEISELFDKFPMVSLSHPIRFLPKLNMTLPEFIRRTGASLGLTRTSCSVARKRAVACHPGVPGNEDIESSFRILRAVPTGVWETRIAFVNDYGDWFRLCDTFTANLTLAPGSESGIVINFLSASRAFVLSSKAVENRTDWVNRTRQFGKPYWDIYFHSKDEPKIAYDSLERTEKIVIRPFTRTEIGLSMKKFNMLPSSTRPCELSANYSYVQCEEQCAERLLPCVLLKRRTNLENLSVSSSLLNLTKKSAGGKRECELKDYEEYTMNYNVHFKRVTNLAMTSACCPLKCSEVQYDYRVVTTDDSDPKLFENLDFTDLTKPRAFSASALIYWRTPNVEVIQHEYSYSFTQYLGELGGTWGLFLGVSIISVLQFLEHLIALIIKCRPKGSNREEGF